MVVVAVVVVLHRAQELMEQVATVPLAL